MRSSATSRRRRAPRSAGATRTGRGSRRPRSASRRSRSTSPSTSRRRFSPTASRRRSSCRAARPRCATPSTSPPSGSPPTLSSRPPHFGGLDLDDPWACVHHFDADTNTEGDYKADAYEHFDRDYREFSTLMDRFLPNAAASAYLDRLRRLTVIRSYARAVFLRERADIDWTAVGAKVKRLLDSRIDATVRTLMAPVSILDAAPASAPRSSAARGATRRSRSRSTSPASSPSPRRRTRRLATSNLPCGAARAGLSVTTARGRPRCRPAAS